MEKNIVRYSTLGLTLHWVMAVVVLIAFLYGPGGSETHVYAASHDFDRQLHETLGFTVLVLAVIRVLWRLGTTTPALPVDSRWMDLAARSVQLAMYILFFALPVTAISGAWLEGHPLTLLGGVEIHPLLANRTRLERASQRSTLGLVTPSCGWPAFMHSPVFCIILFSRMGFSRPCCHAGCCATLKSRSNCQPIVVEV